MNECSIASFSSGKKDEKAKWNSNVDKRQTKKLGNLFSIFQIMMKKRQSTKELH